MINRNTKKKLYIHKKKNKTYKKKKLMGGDKQTDIINNEFMKYYREYKSAQNIYSNNETLNALLNKMEIRKYGKNKEQVFRIYNSGQLTDIKHKSQFVSEMKSAMKIAIDEMKNELELTETIPPICKKYNDTSLCTMLNYYSSEQLKLYFDGFLNFKFLDKIVGVAQGNVYNLVYDNKKGKTMSILLKFVASNIKQNSFHFFSVLYEYLIGKFFMNKYNKIFPCFVETYALYQYSGKIMEECNRCGNYNKVNAEVCKSCFIENAKYIEGLEPEYKEILKRMSKYVFLDDKDLSTLFQNEKILELYESMKDEYIKEQSEGANFFYIKHGRGKIETTEQYNEEEDEPLPLNLIDVAVNNKVNDIDEIVTNICRGVDALALMTSFVPSKIKERSTTLREFLFNRMPNEENKNELLYILFQVYITLSSLGKNFTHYDLHYTNVMIYEINDNKIEYQYHFKDGTEIKFKSNYIIKIIDFEKSYFNNPETNVDTNKIKEILNVNQQCILYSIQYKKFKRSPPISDKLIFDTPNISADLFLLLSIRGRYEQPDWFRTTDDNPDNWFNQFKNMPILWKKIIYTNTMRIPERTNISDMYTDETESGYSKDNTNNTNQLNNINDAANFFKDKINELTISSSSSKSKSSKSKSSSVKNKSDIIGTLHIYPDTLTPMKFVPMT